MLVGDTEALYGPDVLWTIALIPHASTSTFPGSILDGNRLAASCWQRCGRPPMSVVCSGRGGITPTDRIVDSTVARSGRPLFAAVLERRRPKFSIPLARHVELRHLGGRPVGIDGNEHEIRLRRPLLLARPWVLS